MKIYVDELPKSCSKCPCYHNGDYYEDCKCNFTNNYVWYNKNGFFDCSEERRQDCPLQSLAEHDKQVRKEVCDEIYKVLTNEDVWRAFKKCWWLNNGDCKQLRDILDQIQGDK